MNTHATAGVTACQTGDIGQTVRPLVDLARRNEQDDACARILLGARSNAPRKI